MVQLVEFGVALMESRFVIGLVDQQILLEMSVVSLVGVVGLDGLVAADCNRCLDRMHGHAGCFDEYFDLYQLFVGPSFVLSDEPVRRFSTLLTFLEFAQWLFRLALAYPLVLALASACLAFVDRSTPSLYVLALILLSIDKSLCFLNRIYDFWLTILVLGEHRHWSLFLLVSVDACAVEIRMPLVFQMACAR